MPLMPRPSWSEYISAGYAPDSLPGDEPARMERGNRRRLRVFGAVFLLALSAGQAWNMLRPAEYRASARLQFTPPPSSALAAALPAIPPTVAEVLPPGLVTLNSATLLDEVQRLSGRPLLERVVARLNRDARIAQHGGFTVEKLQDMLDVAPVAGSNVIQLYAIGAPPEPLAIALNTLLEVYREDLAASEAEKSNEELAQARKELSALENRITRKRTELEDFRGGHGVFSGERDENETLARIKGLTAALNATNEKLSGAETRLASARAAAASGKGVFQSRDNATLASLEQRASQTREQLRDMERTYTRDFLTMDPQAKALRARLAELDKQMLELRAESQKSALEEAEGEVDGARKTLARLRQQLAQEHQESRVFLQDFNKAKELDNDLSQLEALRRASMARLARLEAGGPGGRPGLGVVAPAAVPLSPWRPDYQRDALIILGVAFLAGLLAMWFVELFHRVAGAPPSTTLVLPQPMAFAPPSEERYLAAPPPPPPHVEAQAMPALSATILPRELDQKQVAALLLAGNPEGRIACAGLLLGLTVDELCALRLNDVDAPIGQLHVTGASARWLALPVWLVEALLEHSPQGAQAIAANSPVLRDAQGAPLRAEDVASLVCAAAHDGGLASAESVTPDLLRHTGIAWLVRQGVRYSDLAGRVGRLSAEHLAAYARLAPGIPRGEAGLAVPLMPALASIDRPDTPLPGPA